MPVPKLMKIHTNVCEQQAPAPEPNIDQDAVSVLVNLGYGRSEAFSAVMQIRQKSNDNIALNLEDLIKLALKELAF